MKTLIGIIAMAILFINNQPVDANKIVSNLVSKLGLSDKYIAEPCRLMPFVELSPLLAMAQLTYTDTKTLKQAQQAYYEIGLSGMLYAACLMTRNLPEAKARAVLQHWVSGYKNMQRKQIVLRDFDTAMRDGKNSTTDKECLEKSINRLKNSQVSKNPHGIITDELKEQQQIMQGKQFSAAELKAATESIAMLCLSSTTGLDDQDRGQLIAVLTKASRFFHHIEGGVLRMIVGDQSQSEVLAILLRGIMNANYLRFDEKMDRLMLILQGDIIASRGCQNKNVQDCVAEIESTDN